MKEYLTCSLNIIEKEIYEGFPIYMDNAEALVNSLETITKEQKENIYEKYRRAFFLKSVNELHLKNREAQIHDVLHTNLRNCIKTALIDFYKLRTMKAEKLEKEISYKDIKHLLKIQKKIEEKESKKKIETVAYFV